MNNNNFDIEKDLQQIDRSMEMQAKNETQNEDEIMKCPKCGNPMKKSARYCMHCGELNYLNSQNDSVKSQFFLGKKLKEKEEKRNAKKEKKRLDIKDENGKTVNEKKFQIQKRIISLIMVILIIIGVINYKVVLETVTSFRAKFYLRQVDKIVNQLVDKIEDGKCNMNQNDDYFVFYQSDDYFKTFVSLYTFDYFKGYIKLEKDSNGQYQYYVSISDGKYGFRNVLYSKELNSKTVQKLEEDLTFDGVSSFMCS